ncbi:MAG: J domain-containing protein [Acidimicrobiia bacterium]
MATDYYVILGVAPNATDDEIKRAYRRLARELHPDANPGDAVAEARFKEVTVAYETLGDSERRRRYDLFGPDGTGSGPMSEAFGVGDLFDAFFGGDLGGRAGRGPQRGADIETRLTITLSEAAFGIARAITVRLPVECERCQGSGCEPGTHPSRCDVCGGAGQVRQVRRSILGQMMTAAPCPACDSTGSRILSPCNDCRGDGRLVGASNLDVEVPAGIDDGQRLRLEGRGPAAPRGGIPGDLYVTVHVEPQPGLVRQGRDLLHACSVSVAQAALGTTVEVPGLEGPLELEVPPGTQPGQVLRLRGEGVTALRSRGRGDLLVHVDVEVPDKLTAEEAELFRQLAGLRGEHIEPPEPKRFSRLRSAFQ